jgi:polyhydroxyalkanoate synthesis repressor PhaR
MTTPTHPPGHPQVEIRKYPNRRYYDTHRSRHLTLEEIRDLIRQGQDVRVVDSATSSDITTKVLTQIILELDAPKLELVPAAFLTQLIRVNDQLLKGFFGTFFSQASHALIEHLRGLETQMKSAATMPSFFPSFNPWAFLPANTAASPPPQAPPASSRVASKSKESELASQIQSLADQVKALQAAQTAGPSGNNRRAKKRP